MTSGQNIPLRKLAEEYKQWHGISGSPKFCALKLSLKDLTWAVKNPSFSQPSERSFQMKNTSPVQGAGLLQTVKEGKPTTTVLITKGVVSGYPKRTKLDLKRLNLERNLGHVINIDMGNDKTQVVDPTMLQVDAQVNLSNHETKYATVQNAEITGCAHFEGKAELSGLVLFEDAGQVEVVEIFRESGIEVRGRKVMWNVQGTLNLNFEDNQTLKLE